MADCFALKYGSPDTMWSLEAVDMQVLDLYVLDLYDFYV